MKTITVREFEKRVRKSIGWNAAIGFWCEIYALLCRRKVLTLSQAFSRLQAYANYTGTRV